MPSRFVRYFCFTVFNLGNQFASDTPLSSPQNTADALSDDTLATLSSKTTELQTLTTAANATAKSLRSTLSTLNSTLSTADLLSSITSLEAEKAKIESRLLELKEGKAKKVTEKERDAIENEWNKWNDVARRREKISKEMWRLIEDTLSDKEKRTEVREVLGLDE